MNIGPFLREFENKRMNMKLENIIVKDRLTSKTSGFSLKAFFIQLTLGFVGLGVMFMLDPVVKAFKEGGGNSPLAFWGYLLSGICVVIGCSAVFDLIKKILRL